MKEAKYHIGNAVDTLDRKLGLYGYKDYIQEHLGSAIDTAHHGGSMFDLDNIVALKEVLKIDVSYELYSFIDREYDDSLLEILDTENIIQQLWGHVNDYMNNVVNGDN